MCKFGNGAFEMETGCNLAKSGAEYNAALQRSRENNAHRCMFEASVQGDRSLTVAALMAETGK